ncbi:aldehyde dehydrogenase family protein [Stomatohabitans albus]|uniref:aldehyde dehydrogenase family protein n=1 Tax=Stomatohabitans albus TaxID=3110766 RepID=UPI00300CB2EC
MPITTVDPSSHSILTTYAQATPEDVQAVLMRGQDTFIHEWRDMPLLKRARVVNTFADTLEAHTVSLATLMAKEMGKPIREGQAEIIKSVALLRAVAARAEQYFTIHHQADWELDHDGLDVAIDIAPIGGLLAIMPWNFPVWQIMRVFAPNAVGGNVVYLKHAEGVTGTALQLEALWRESGAPSGVFQTLVIPHEQIEPIIAHDHIQGVTFTGSVPTGRYIAQLAGSYGKKTVLELGGSDPFCITDDADLEQAVTTLVTARFSNCGQVCTAAKRAIVHESVYDQVVAMLLERIGNIRIGNPLDDETEMGPMASMALRDQLQDQIERAVAQGARVRMDAKPLERSGAWMAPMVLEVGDTANPAAREEVFGPVLVLLRAKDDDQLVELANDTPFGLGATVFSGNTERGIAIARRIESGMVAINTQNLSHPIVPFGGIKASGYGRELGPWGATEFMNIRTISVRR